MVNQLPGEPSCSNETYPTTTDSILLRKSVHLPLAFHRILSPPPPEPAYIPMPSPTFSKRKKSLKTQISPIACSSMSAIEEEVKKIQSKNREKITRSRTSSFKKPLRDEGIQLTPIIEKLKFIKREVILRRFALAPQQTIHIKKTDLKRNHTGYSLTFSEHGEVFIHVPVGEFQSGGQSLVKFALEVISTEGFAVNKTIDEDYQGAKVLKEIRGKKEGKVKKQLSPEEKMRKEREKKFKPVLGAVRVKDRCSGCKNLLIPHDFIAKISTEGDINIPGTQCYRRYIYTFSKFQRSGDLGRKVFEGEYFLRLALGLASGTRALHRAGFVHRDLKPDNMYMDDGVPLIGDFGTIGSVEDILNRKSTISIKRFTRYTEGTQAYKPPETSNSLHQIDPRKTGPVEKFEYDQLPFTDFERNHPVEFAQRGDIYSLGICFLELSRQISNQFALRDEHQLLLVEAVREHRLAIFEKGGLDYLIQKMLATNPIDRPVMDDVIASLWKLIFSERNRSNVLINPVIGLYRQFDV